MPHTTLAICDLNAAVAAKDNNIGGSCHTEICLLAQFAQRITGKKVKGSTRSVAQLKGEKNYNFYVEGIGDLVQLFDAAWDISSSNIAEIRRALPLNVEYQYDVSV